jgi:hypothetical protein
MEKQIIEKAILSHKEFRLKKGKVAEHTIAAIKITNKWQTDCELLNDKIKKEEKVSNNNSEKIDIVDFEEMTAYELKVSGKNPHHEFYKDLIKILNYNCNNTANPIRKFIFLTEEDGIKSLKKRFINEIKDYIEKTHNITIELQSVNSI